MWWSNNSFPIWHRWWLLPSTRIQPHMRPIHHAAIGELDGPHNPHFWLLPCWGRVASNDLHIQRLLWHQRSQSLQEHPHTLAASSLYHLQHQEQVCRHWLRHIRAFPRIQRRREVHNRVHVLMWQPRQRRIPGLLLLRHWVLSNFHPQWTEKLYCPIE